MGARGLNMTDITFETLQEACDAQLTHINRLINLVHKYNTSGNELTNANAKIVALLNMYAGPDKANEAIELHNTAIIRLNNTMEELQEVLGILKDDLDTLTTIYICDLEENTNKLIEYVSEVEELRNIIHSLIGNSK